MSLLADCPPVLTVAEAARLLRLSLNGTYLAIQRGDLPACRVGRRLLIARDALEGVLTAPPVGSGIRALEQEEKRILEWNPDA